MPVRLLRLRPVLCQWRHSINFRVHKQSAVFSFLFPFFLLFPLPLFMDPGGVRIKNLIVDGEGDSFVHKIEPSGGEKMKEGLERPERTTPPFFFFFSLSATGRGRGHWGGTLAAER